MNDKSRRNIYKQINDKFVELDAARKKNRAGIDRVFNLDEFDEVPFLELPTAPEYRIPDKFKPLNRFFNGKLTEADVIRFAEFDVTHDSNEGRYSAMKDTIRVPRHCDVVMLWQWDENSPVFSLYMPQPVVANRIEDIIPKQYLAKRIAIMAMADGYVSINLVYMLTGIISQHDPIHEEIRKHGR